MKIGIVNLMHDKVATQARFTKRLQQWQPDIKITYFYPVDHYRNRPVPATVAAISQPLDLNLVATMDAMIITGAPVERLDFEAVTYYPELTRLFDLLAQRHLPTLFVCWGAMAALHYFFGIEKQSLTHKYFGGYSQRIQQPTPLLTDLPRQFIAPHARYAEVNHDQVNQVTSLAVNATTTTDELFLLTQQDQPFSYLFAHLEYDGAALQQEFAREQAAWGGMPAQPVNYDLTTGQPLFSWETTSQRFFRNWLTQVQVQGEK